MIDAQAISAHLTALGDLRATNQNPQSGADWLASELAKLNVTAQRDDAGDLWITLPGKNARTVVLGSYLAPHGAPQHLDSDLGLVTALETLRALAHRYADDLPATVQLVVWANPDITGAYALHPKSAAAAYLELHVERYDQLGTGNSPLAVAELIAAGEVVAHPRLKELCDEAIRELTGTSGSAVTGAAPYAAAMGRAGVPVGVLVVQTPTTTEDPNESRLHYLQAAETFGRWAEATVHLVAGDAPDLWAKEHRTPHN